MANIQEIVSAFQAFLKSPTMFWLNIIFLIVGILTIIVGTIWLKRKVGKHTGPWIVIGAGIAVMLNQIVQLLLYHAKP